MKQRIFRGTVTAVTEDDANSVRIRPLVTADMPLFMGQLGLPGTYVRRGGQKSTTG